MKIKKEYTFTNNRQIWRLLPSNSWMVIEDRDIETKEAFFSCIEIKTGKKIFKNFQMDEKYWVGIETIKNNTIFFHKYVKPDMPGHKGIFAYDIKNQKFLWENENAVFLFWNDQKIICYNELFEGRKFYELDSQTGAMLNELGNNSEEVNKIREGFIKENEYKDYNFTEPFKIENEPDSAVSEIINEIKNSKIIFGKIDYIIKNSLLFFNYHQVQDDGSLKNQLNIFDLNSREIIYEEILNKKSNSYVPDSFFIKGDLIFILIEKNMLKVCSIVQ
jgi:hypothetical protein